MTRTLSRRDFLKLGAATVAGLAVTPAARARALRPLPPDDADPQ
ncbi:MAG: twin-arginine translocation signal domain-containing protein, partial [Anaerolineales bacterium]